MHLFSIVQYCTDNIFKLRQKTTFPVFRNIHNIIIHIMVNENNVYSSGHHCPAISSYLSLYFATHFISARKIVAQH